MKKTINLLILLLLCLSVNAQYQKKITGTVTDDNREPIIGASILVKNTTIGTITDLDGRFSLTLNDPAHTILVVTYLGFKTQEIVIDDTTNYTIILNENAMMLDEVVVSSYGVQKKSTMTGAISSVSASAAGDSKEKESSGTWKRSGMKDNSIRLEVGANDFIPLESAQMTVQIDGFRVRVLLDCFFYNDKGSQLEGVFKLKLPAEATPYYMAFGETNYLDKQQDDRERVKRVPFINHKFDGFNMSYQHAIGEKDDYWGNVKEARIVSKQKAAKAYEQTVNRRVDPALMEWGGADMFSCKVYPLSNNTLHRIAIGYDLNMVEAMEFRELV